ncbi:MAG: GlsB/YeaQ/YmgE family stress response membrane protein [Hyphomicrobiales bacterium]|nr:GlsB/YeaQ/YmgE family stress response membrane protein [Hyphomicrobiales bacterium]
MILGSRHWIFTNILIGIAGSYVGSEIADLAHFGLRNSLDHFLAALIGSIIVLMIWRGLHRTDAYQQRRM